MNKNITRYLLCALVLFTGSAAVNPLRAQTTISSSPSFTNNNGSGLATFNFENTNGFPVVITDISTVLRTAGSSTFTLYYNTTPVSAPPGIIPASAAWTTAATNVINSTVGGAANQTLEPVFTGISLIIPANTTYGFAVGGFTGTTTTGSMAYYTMPATPATVLFSGGGCNMINGVNVSYGATSSTTAATFTPRGFVGSITFEPLGGPNDAGIDSLISPDSTGLFCSGKKEVAVRLKNFGTNILDNVTINWSVNGSLQTPVSFATPLPDASSSGNWAAVTLGEADFPYNTGTLIKAWTTQPNNVADTANGNDTLSVTVTAQLQGVEVNINPEDTTICQGTTITLDAGDFTEGPIYIWNQGIVTQSITVSEAGVYHVKVMNSMGCSDRDTITVNVYPNPVVNSITVINNGDGSFTFNVLGAQHITSYTWDFGDGTTQPGTGLPGQQVHTFTTAGAYTLILTLRNDCGTITTSRLINFVPTSVQETSALSNDFKLYPNPSKGTVTLTNDLDIKIKSVRLINILGQTVYENKNINTSQYKFDISTNASGVYTVLLETTAGQVKKKLQVIN